jgi:hypothetical protein
MMRMPGLSKKHRDGLRYIRRLFCSGALLSLCIAVTAPATIAASEKTSAPDSLAVRAQYDAVFILAVSGGISTAFVLRPVNLATGSFTSHSTIQLRANILGFGDEMKGGGVPDDGSPNVSSLGRGLQLLMASIPAGDYAITKVWFGNLYECLNNSAVVVRVIPGKITIVSSGDVSPPNVFSRTATNVDRGRILRAFDRARMNYPNLAGEPVNAEIVGRISWQMQTDFFGDGCQDAEQFSTIQAITADTSAARAAALEEAQKNLTKAKSVTPATDGAAQAAPSAATGSKQ